MTSAHNSEYGPAVVDIVGQSTARRSLRVSTFTLGRQTLSSQLAVQLRAAILRNELYPGARLTEPAIAAQAGVGRSTVREALRILALDGLVSLVPMSGARVVVLSHRDISEIAEVRVAIEVRAARKVVLLNDDQRTEQIELMLRNLIHTRQSSSWSALANADVQFHRSVVSAAANTRLLRFWDQLEGQLLLLLSFHAEDVYQAHDVAREHEVLMNTLRSGNPDMAAEAFEQHIVSRMQVREQLWSFEVLEDDRTRIEGRVVGKGQNGRDET